MGEARTDRSVRTAVKGLSVGLETSNRQKQHMQLRGKIGQMLSEPLIKTVL